MCVLLRRGVAALFLCFFSRAERPARTRVKPRSSPRAPVAQDLAVAPLLVLLPLVAGSGPQSASELGLLAAKATFGFGSVLAVGSVVLRYVYDAVAAARSTETFVAATLLVAVGMGQVGC
jgi:hypothetical protein